MLFSYGGFERFGGLKRASLCACGAAPRLSFLFVGSLVTFATEPFFALTLPPR